MCKRCEYTGVDSLKTILQQQQDDAMLDLVGLCRVWRVYIYSRTQMQVSDPGFTLSDDLVQVHEEHVLKEAQAPTGPVAPRD